MAMADQDGVDGGQSNGVTWPAAFLKKTVRAVSIIANSNLKAPAIP
jgi:hypothetical protein